MNEAQGQLSSAVRAILANDELTTSQLILDTINQLRAIPMFSTITDAQAEAVKREIESSMDITMNLASVLQTEFREWLGSRKAEIEPYYWERYYRHLGQEKFPPRVITKLDQVTDRILGLLQNPDLDGRWDRRGLVVGHVQSGKTANYTGVVCKAADAGYKLIIVIAGIHNNLRNQTQKRLDEGFVGRDSITGRKIGVGKFDSQFRPLTVTTSQSDFSKAAATAIGIQLKDLKVPALLVIKKNMHTLRNLTEWLTAHNANQTSNLVHVPMLLIDDEADNASIDISSNPEESSRINSQIRELLALFSRSCYVGYTATPFANIFVDPATNHDMLGEDLFPKDFIVSLEPPSNYFGATKIFLPEADENIVNEIIDNEDILPIKHPKLHELPDIPESLKEAVRSFIIARSIRIIRGQGNKHQSMLVNASRFIRVQGEIEACISYFLNELKRNIRFEYKKEPTQALKNRSIRQLFDTLRTQYSNVDITWKEVQRSLNDAAASIRVVEINSKSSGALDYANHEEHGLHIIAIGGFSLSRGLTLEGLTTSYFLRNSMMYDTLMQMGRWFGFRPGYEDLCRLWMSPDAIGWYEHISDSIEELREEFVRMEQLRLTPREFGLKVRSHPDTLIVTARNKMRSAENVPVKIGLANSFIETYALSTNTNIIDQNIQSANGLVTRLENEFGHETRIDGEYLWKNIPAEFVLTFLDGFVNKTGSWHTEPKPVSEYIRKRMSINLGKWDIALISLKKENEHLTDESLGLSVNCQTRSVGSSSTKDCFFITEKQRVASRGVEKIGLTKQQQVTAVAAWEKYADQHAKNIKNVPDRYYRKERERPLLILHMLKLKLGEKKPSEDLNIPENPVFAWGMSFPKAETEDSTVEYTVNSTWLRSIYGDDRDEDEIEDENE